MGKYSKIGEPTPNGENGKLSHWNTLILNIHMVIPIGLHLHCIDKTPKKPISLNPIFGSILRNFKLKFTGMIYNWSIDHSWKFHWNPINFNFCSIFIKNEGFSLCFFSIFDKKLKLLGFQWNFQEWFID